MNFIPVFEYLAGLFVFGFIKLIFDDIIDGIRVVSETGNVYDLGNYLWTAIVIIYVLGGALYLWLKYNSPIFRNPGGF